MNERIQELLDQIRVNEQIERLAKQAGCTIDRLGYGEGNLEKFAELIVRECQYAIVSRQDLPAHERKLYNNVLKQHFGVEDV